MDRPILIFLFPLQFLPHEGSLALRLEGIQMMAALLEQLRSEPSTKLHLNTPVSELHFEQQKNTPAELQLNSPAAKLQLNSVDGMAQQLFAALRRHAVVRTEVSRVQKLNSEADRCVICRCLLIYL